MNKLSISIICLFLLTSVCSCQSVSLEEQRVMATAYVQDEIDNGQKAAEQGAMALCNIDLDQGKEAYQQKVCEQTTAIGCQVISIQIDNGWQGLTTTYQLPRLTCELKTSQLLEEGYQFGMKVQFWLVKLEGEDYYPQNSSNREYWLQVALEEGSWKLNRYLLVDEIRYYTIIEFTNQKQ